MLSATHRLTETITNALGPIFRDNPDYPTIVDAMCLVMARVIQASPDKGREFKLLDHVHMQTAHCLEEFIKLEEQLAAQREVRQNVLDKGVDGFAELGRINGARHGSEDDVEVVEPKEDGPLLEPEEEFVVPENTIEFPKPKEGKTAEEDVRDYPDAMPKWNPDEAGGNEPRIDEEGPQGEVGH